ncbi:uncharacterized protein LOC121008814 [Bufo bufo]|uniref:uncharacterized protein LOC121008814 n=1 Tax=Bufo bufo TaxID=8384 RepID=UPI001ABE639B|nr:uncharacterized protein LOC121008814 [Bufo bufo]
MENISSSSEAGRTPPRRRRRHDTSSSEEELHSGQEEIAEGIIGGGGQEIPPRPVASQRGPRASARGSRGACSGRGRGSRISTRMEEEVGFFIDNELLIQLVEARPALWDHTDRRHADNHATLFLWHEIGEAIVPNWEDLGDRQQEQCRATIMVQWQSIRDCYEKDYNKELRTPSGSGGTSRQEFRYHSALGFLRRTLELQRSSSTTRAPEVPQEAVLDEPATAGPSRPAQGTGQDSDVPLPPPPGDATMAQLAPLFEAIIRRQGTGRSRQADYEDLTRLVYESLMGFTNRVARLEDNLRRLQEGTVLTLQMSPVQLYLNSLVPVMEQFTPDQLFEARSLMDCALWQVQHRPTSYLPPHTYPPSQSQTHELFSYHFSPSTPHYYPPTSFTTPSNLAQQTQSPAPSSTLNTPTVALAPTCTYLSTVAEQQQDRGLLTRALPSTPHSSSPPRPVFRQL